MHKDIPVLLNENDPYARDLMALLLTRDWRTRVVVDLSDRMKHLPSQLSGDHDNALKDLKITEAEASTLRDFLEHAGD